MTRAGESPKALVIVRAGDNSLHESWLPADGDRPFTLAVSYYGDQAGRWQERADHWSPAKGPKWGPLADWVDDNWSWVSAFDYVAFPDDDLAASGDDWATLFAVMAELDLDLAQPSLDYRSYWTHQITAQRPAYRARFTNFVEVMTPVFSAWALRLCLPTFRISPSGFGLDVVWPSILGQAGGRLGIVDEVAFGHTRPFNGAGGASRTAEAAGNVYRQLDHPPVIDEIVVSQLFGVRFPFDPVIYDAVPRCGVATGA